MIKRFLVVFAVLYICLLIASAVTQVLYKQLGLNVDLPLVCKSWNRTHVMEFSIALGTLAFVFIDSKYLIK